MEKMNKRGKEDLLVIASILIGLVMIFLIWQIGFQHQILKLTGSSISNTVTEAEGIISPLISIVIILLGVFLLIKTNKEKQW